MKDKFLKDVYTSSELKKEIPVFDDPVVIRKTSPVLIGLTIIITILLDGFIRTYFELDFFNILSLVIEFIFNLGDSLLGRILITTDAISNLIENNT
jgi:hypothetical protein